jgi:signal transduction histidine kinase/response regulator RpfG family c-di-GMP phosphodiesterase
MDYDKLSAAYGFFDEKGVLNACNLAWARLFGLEEKAEAISGYGEYFPEKSREKLAGGVARAMQDGEFSLEISCFNASGDMVFLDIKLSREDEKCVTGLAFDVTKYKNTPDKILLEAAPLAVALWDNKNSLVDCNKQTVELFGLNTTEEYGTRFIETIPEIQPNGTPSWKIGAAMFTQAFEKGYARFEFMRRHAVTGEAIPVETTMVRIKYNEEAMVASFITDLRPVKIAMERENEAVRRWKSVLDTMPIGVNMYDENNVMIDVNQTMLDQFACVNKEEYIERWKDTFPERQPDGSLTIEKFGEVIKTLFEGGTVPVIEWQMQTIYGDPIPMHINSVMVYESKKPMLVTYATDLRPIHEAMKQVEEEQQFNNILYENSPHGVSIWTQDGRVVRANRQLLKIFGAEDYDEFLKNFNRFYEEFQPSGAYSEEGFYAYLRRAFDGETVRFEWINLNVQGIPIPLEITFVRYKRGNEFFVAAYTVDLSEVKATMAQLREADQRSAVLIDALPIASALIGADYLVLTCNQAAVNLLARTSDAPFEYKHSDDGEVYHCDNICAKCDNNHQSICIARRCLIRNWRHTIMGYQENRSQIEDLLISQCEHALENGRSTQTSYRKTLTGEELFVETTLVPVMYNGKQGWALYMRDLREARLREVAEEESRAKTRFLARMSHEIRTPMNAVLGVTEIQLQKGSHDNETEEAFLRIHQSSSMLLSIINDILDLSKVEAGKMEIVPQRYEFTDLIIETVQLNLMHLGEKPINFKLEIDENMPKFMEGDELRLKQVMNNLLSNAFKYTEEGEIFLHFSRENTDDPETIFMVIKVQDTGQGMSKSQLNTLFEIEFNRLNLHLNRDIQGSGLGMTITFSLVNLMHGKISVESAPGKGSLFTVKIPQKICDNKVLGADAAKLQNIEAVKNSLKKISRQKRETMSHGKVLIVDDVESNLFVAKGMLMPYKLSVETVMSGFEAVEKIKSGNTYDIIFMDHMMPGLDGIEATSRIRNEGYDLPIVALTANILVGQEEMFLNSGFNGFISKPIDVNKLDDCLKQFIGKNDMPKKPTNSAPVLSEALTASFLRDAVKVTKTLKDLIISQKFDDDAIKLYTINFHAMKSALANIGAAELSDIAYALEEASRATDTDTIKAETLPFLESLAEIVKRLTPETTNSADQDPALLTEKLQDIRTACEAYDKKSARKALATLNEKQWSPQTKAMLENITAALLHSNFEEAGRLAWDPDFTKVTPEEATRISNAEKSGFVADEDIDWEKIGV